MAAISWHRVSELEIQYSNLRRILIVLVAGPGILNLLFGITLSLWFISACLALALRVFRHLDTISQELKRLSQGLHAEDLVYNWLELLPPDWSVERRIEIDNADIDLLVTTPQGITVAIEVKSHRGNIKLENNKLIREGSYELDSDFIEILKKRASKLALRRGLPSIACVIVFTNAKLNVPQAGVNGVFIRDLIELIPFLHKIDTQTRKFNALRRAKYGQELVQVVAEKEENYEYCKTRDSISKEFSLTKMLRSLSFYVSDKYRVKPHQCFRCHEMVVVFTWDEHAMCSQAMPPRPIPRSVKYRYSRSLQKKYWVNTCHNCGATLADSFVYSKSCIQEEGWMRVADFAPVCSS